MMISFKKALDEGMDFAIYPHGEGEGKEIMGVFSNLRVDAKTLPKGWFKYDIRHGDDGDFCSLEPGVLVNHAGTFLTQTLIELPDYAGRKVMYLDDEKTEYDADCSFL